MNQEEIVAQAKRTLEEIEALERILFFEKVRSPDLDGLILKICPFSVELRKFLVKHEVGH